MSFSGTVRGWGPFCLSPVVIYECPTIMKIGTVMHELAGCKLTKIP